MKTNLIQTSRNVCCFSLLALALVPASLFGATLIATNSADSGPGTLRERIAAANPGDTIQVAVGSPIVLSSQLVISKNLRIDDFSPPGVKISGNNQTRIFNVVSGLLELHDLTIADGRVGGTNGAAGANGETVSGGAILVAMGASLSMDKCVISNNVAQGGQGGGQGQFGSAGNGGNGFGGAIGSLGTLYLVRSMFVANSASGGLGGLAPTGTPGTGGQGWGGAIYSGGLSTLFECTLYHNAATAGTGGGGPGGGSGGGLYNEASMTVNVSTIVSNTASGSSFDFGGGIAHNGSSMTVRDCTIVGNEADYGGGVTGGQFINTIIAGNVAANGPDGSGAIQSVGLNLIQNTNGMTLSGVLAGSIFGQDPLLGPLQDNGSRDTEYTPPNMMPLPGSPVIDKGGPYYDFDQRRYNRPYDTDIPNTASGGDIGAIEVQPTTFVVVNNNNSGAGSLRQAILDNNGLGGGNIIVFSNNVTGTITLSGSELVITAPASIVGPGANVLAVCGNNSVRVFSILRGPSQISGLTICDGLDVGTAGQPGQKGFDGRGAGIYTQDTLSVSGCTIRSNRVFGGLGGAANQGIVGQGGKGLGAGLYNATGSLVLEFCSLEANLAVGGQGGSAVSDEGGGGGNGLGGAISSGGGTLQLFSCNLMNNVARGGQGGAGATVGNGGQGYGGAINNENPTTAIHTTIAGCSAIGGTGAGGNGSGYGGAINNLSTLSLSLCTVASNTASGSSFDFGGGISNDGTLGLTNVTIAGNQADYGGGLSGNANLAGSIIAANQATTSGADVSGTITSYDYNLIQSFSGLNILGATAHVIIGQDPLLGPLANNGGFEPTMALRPGSPAIDQGKNFTIAVDQRSAPRPFDLAGVANAAGGDGSDIGAFELGQPLLSLFREASTVVIRWPSYYGDFVLESKPALGVGSWNTVATAPIVGPGFQFYVTNSLAAGNQFFRLKSR
jgi:hypothetical protein